MANPNPPLENLRPFKPGQSGNPAGPKPGTKHLKTIIQEIGNNIDWNKTTLKDKQRLRELYGKNAWKAVVYVAFTKALAGDSKAMDWLAKNGYDQKFEIKSSGDAISPLLVKIVRDNGAANNDNS